MKISINGKDHEWPDDTISYQDVVAMAYSPSEPRLMSVTYYWRGSGTSDTHREGTLRPNGARIKAARGMIFNAYHTSNA